MPPPDLGSDDAVRDFAAGIDPMGDVALRERSVALKGAVNTYFREVVAERMDTGSTATTSSATSPPPTSTAGR